MKKILLLPHGTSGDVFPFIWLGRLLKQHNHRVTLIAARAFERASLRAGVDFMPLARDDFDEMLAHPGLFKIIEGTQVAHGYAGRATGDYAAAIELWMARNGRPDLMLAPMTCFGARLIREKIGIPLVTVHAYPLLVNSAHAPPLFIPAFRWLRWLPLALRRLVLSGPNPFDRYAHPHVRKACDDHGVPAPQSLRWEWWDSPDGVLALFPAWYGPPQPDWPRKLLQWDFPLEDLSHEEKLSPALKTFMEAGDKPVLFTAGTGHRHARNFFETALQLVTQIQCRAVFVTHDLNQLPASLPASVHAVTYAPFSLLLPHVAAFVHHGGMGTVAQCLAAGVPQLIVPMAHDQFDNADRVNRLGVGLVLGTGGFSLKRVLPLLKRCLEDSGIRQRAAACAERMRPRPDTEKLELWLAQKCERTQTQSTSTRG
ncbi:MAG: glycosyltransferase [Prosthecobacter sp.]